MSVRQFLVRGLLAGLLAGVVAFVVAYAVGEPPVEAAIALEEAGAEPAPHTHDDAGGHSHDGAAHEHGEEAEQGHSHGEEGGITRSQQSTWGLLTGTVAIGTALGGIVALLAAAVAGRWGRLSVAASTALVTFLGYVSFSLVPFLKYPAAPPAVGSGDTIGERTASYFAFVALSVLAVVAACLVARRLAALLGAYRGVVAGVAVYVVAVGVLAVVLPTVNEIGAFPADVLWEFRLGSLLTLTALWGTLGIALAGALGRLADTYAETARADEARRELAASI